MTLVGIECILTSFQEGLHQKLFFRNSGSKMPNCIIVDIVDYHLKTLSNSFFFTFTKMRPVLGKPAYTRG